MYLKIYGNSNGNEGIVFVFLYVSLCFFMFLCVPLWPAQTSRFIVLCGYKVLAPITKIKSQICLT